MRRSIVSLLCLPVLLMACATTGAAPSTSGASNSTRISQEELIAADLPTAYDLVDRLRRPWLRRDALTGAEVAVYMDNQHIGGAQRLREIRAADIAELQYLSHDEATRRWGNQVTGSVILITRRN